MVDLLHDKFLAFDEELISCFLHWKQLCYTILVKVVFSAFVKNVSRHAIAVQLLVSQPLDVLAVSYVVCDIIVIVMMPCPTSEVTILPPIVEISVKVSAASPEATVPFVISVPPSRPSLPALIVVIPIIVPPALVAKLS